MNAAEFDGYKPNYEQSQLPTQEVLVKHLRNFFNKDELLSYCFDFGIVSSSNDLKKVHMFTKSQLAEYIGTTLSESNHLQNLNDAIARDRTFLGLQETGARPYLIDTQIFNLKMILQQRFSQGQFNSLCFDLGVDRGDLHGDKTNKIEKLIIQFAEKNSLQTLIEEVKKVITIGGKPDSTLTFAQSQHFSETQPIETSLTPEAQPNIPEPSVIRDGLKQFAKSEIEIILSLAELNNIDTSLPLNELNVAIALYIQRHGTSDYSKLLRAVYAYKPDFDFVSLGFVQSEKEIPTKQTEKIRIFSELVKKITTKVEMDDVCLDIFGAALSEDLLLIDRRNPNLPQVIVRLLDELQRNPNYGVSIADLPQIAETALTPPISTKDLDELTTLRDYVSYLRVKVTEEHKFTDLCNAFGIDSRNLEGVNSYERALYFVVYLKLIGKINSFKEVLRSFSF